MRIKRKPTAWAVLGAYVVWTGLVQPIWNLNVERAAEQGKLDTALLDGGVVMDWLGWLASYIPSSFGLGFALGALIFAYWDVIAAKIPFYRPAIPSLVKRPAFAWVGQTDFEASAMLAENGFWISVWVYNAGTSSIFLRGVSGQPIAEMVQDDKSLITVALPPPIVEKIEHIDELHPRAACWVRLFQPCGKHKNSIVAAASKNEAKATLDFRTVKLDFFTADLGDGCSVQFSEKLMLSKVDTFCFQRLFN